MKCAIDGGGYSKSRSPEIITRLPAKMVSWAGAKLGLMTVGISGAYKVVQ